MLSGYVNNDGCETYAIDLFADMRVMLGEICLEGPSHEVVGFRLLATVAFLMVKCANDYDRFAASSRIDVYSKCGCLRYACEVFKGSCDGSLDLVSKNTMVATCCREGELEMAKNLFW
ncbi:Pentatricopeptide repeat [Dillenia turbinata]|uniref:Pentatricopeptide repeat n=1 Tax=Dillenia turbinata TaxID=194707 RepID=A0AAN8Z0R9_9MAGN